MAAYILQPSHDGQGNLAKRPIARASCAAPEDFERRFVTAREPVILTGLVTQWRAFNKWTPEYFQATYGDVVCRVVVDMPTAGVSYEADAKNHLREMRLRDFVDYMRRAEKPCYFRRQHAQKMLGLEQDCDFARLTPDDKAETNFVWIGSAGTRTGLHFDMQDNILCQIYGSKEIWLVEPAAAKFLYTYPGSITKSRVAPDSPDLAQFPKYANATVMHGTLGPGEALFIPNCWWHSVISLSPSISVSHEFGRKITWPQVARAISAGGLGHWANVMRDFVWYGLLGQRFSRRLADDPPFGRLLYEMFRSTLASRLDQRSRI